MRNPCVQCVVCIVVYKCIVCVVCILQFVGSLVRTDPYQGNRYRYRYRYRHSPGGIKQVFKASPRLPCGRCGELHRKPRMAFLSSTYVMQCALSRFVSPWTGSPAVCRLCQRVGDMLLCESVSEVSCMFYVRFSRKRREREDV